MSKEKACLLFLFAIGWIVADSTAYGTPQLYWTGGYDLSPIQRSSLNGMDIQTLISGLNTPTDIALDVSGGKMYWGMWFGMIARANLDGTDPEVIVLSGQNSVWGVDVDDRSGKVYWADPFGKMIRRANLDGTQIQDVVMNIAQPVGLTLDLDHGKLYWTDEGTGKIQRSNLDGSEKEDILITGSLWNLADVELDLVHGKLYWTESDGKNSIGRANLDGTDKQYLLSGMAEEPYCLALDVSSNAMYWTTYQGNVIRADLEGLNSQKVVSMGERNTWGIAITPEPATLGLAFLGGLVLMRKRRA